MLRAVIAACVGVVLLIRPAAAQHQTFVDGLSEFTAALPGTYGDEAVAARASLDRIERGLEEWDRTLREYAANIVSVSPTATPARRLEMHRTMGMHYLSRGRYDAAVSEFDAALAISPVPAFQVLRGLAYDAAGRPAKALEAYEAAWTLDRTDAAAAYKLADASVRAGSAPPPAVLTALADVVDRIAGGQYKSERDPFDVAALIPDDLTDAPMFVPWTYSKAYALLEHADYARAVEALRAAIAQDPLFARSESPALLRGAQELRGGRVARAVDELTAALNSASNAGLGARGSEAHRLLGVAYWLSADTDRTIEQLEQAIRLVPTDERARIMLARVLEESGDAERAERLLVETAKAIPASAIAHYRLAKIYAASNRTEDAVREYEAVVENGVLAGEEPMLLDIGALHRRELDIVRAEAAFAKAVARRPNDAVAHRERGRVLLQLERPEAAFVELAAALIVDARDYDSCLAIGQIHLDAGRYPAAVKVLGYAASIDRDRPEAYYSLATALTRSGQREQAAPHLETFARLQARAFEEQRRRLELGAARLQAHVLTQNSEFARAVEAWTRLLAAGPDSAAGHAGLAAALAGLGKLEAAAAEYEKALALDPGTSVHRELIALYEKMGRTDAAAATRVKLAAAHQRAFGAGSPGATDGPR